MGRLSNKVAIVTGAASGIGRGVAERFLEEGARVIIADINQEQGQATAEALGTQCRFLRTDVTQESDIKALVDFAVREFGRLDIMHNNAGAFGARGNLEDLSADGFDATMSLLVKSVFLGIKHAAAVMKQQPEGGSIINTASISATTPGFGPHIYQAAKAAVLQLSKTLALECAQWQVRVNCVSPGGVYTPLISNAFGLNEQALSQLAQQAGAAVPMGRPGTPLDIANGALFFASDDARFVTGQNLIVDGGESTGKPYAQQGIH